MHTNEFNILFWGIKARALTVLDVVGINCLAGVANERIRYLLSCSIKQI